VGDFATIELERVNSSVVSIVNLLQTSTRTAAADVVDPQLPTAKVCDVD
jgi:hypothetical protein